MRHGLKLAALLVAAAFTFLAPVGNAQSVQTGFDNPYQSTETTLFFHLIDIKEHIPMNTQEPDPSWSDTSVYGHAAHTLSCIDTPTTSGTFHTFYGYASPSYVQYNVTEARDDGREGPRIHPERGLSFDIDLDTGVEPVLYWYLETQILGSDIGGNTGVEPNVAPTVVPFVNIQATWREGDGISLGDEKLNTGIMIAQGQTPEGALLSPATVDTYDWVSHSTVDGRHVYEFRVPLSYVHPSGIIPRGGEESEGNEGSYNMRVDVFLDYPQGVDIPVCDAPEYPSEQSIMTNQVRLHTSPDHRSRMDMAVMNPLVIDYLHPQFILGDMVIHSSMNSPHGNYDVDEQPGGITIDVVGPNGFSPSSLERIVVQKFHEHDHHQEAVDVTWLWDYRAEGAPDGIYEITVTARNDQGNAQATAVRLFQIGDGGGEPPLPECDPDLPVEEQVDCITVEDSGGGEDSPGIGLVMAVGLLGAAAYLARRRF